MCLFLPPTPVKDIWESKKERERENPDENEKTMDSQTLLVEVDIINTLEGILN